MWAQQVAGKIVRVIREQSGRDVSTGEIRCIESFCIDQEIACPEKRLATLTIDLASFLAEYVETKKSHKDVWDACVSAAVRYFGRRALHLRK